MTNLDRRVLLGIAGFAGAAIATQVTKAGSLNPPPGPVTPTGKTTDQIEPRIDLFNAPASANVTSDANSHYIINNSGSYYLSANLAVSKPTGILIAAPAVTLDLCGFEISGSATSNGVFVVSAGEGATVSNGSMRGLDFAISAQQSKAVTFSRLSATQCQTGLDLSAGGIADHCVARGNARLGFQVLNGFCVLTDCVADGNGGGFSIGSGSLMARCVASRNTTYSAISASYNCVLTDCTASANGSAASPLPYALTVQSDCLLTRCVASNNFCGIGISVASGSIVIDCAANNNTVSSCGICLADHGVARGCSATANLNAGSSNRGDFGAGFLVNGDACIVEDCVASGNAGFGIGIGLTAQSSTVNQVRVHRCETSENGFDGIQVYANDVTVAQCRSIKNNGSGIHVQAGSSNIVETNQVLGNTGSGVQVDSAIALVFGNQARGNSLGNYSIVAGNRVGTIMVPATNASAISGNSGGSAFTTDPYANIAF